MEHITEDYQIKSNFQVNYIKLQNLKCDNLPQADIRETFQLNFSVKICLHCIAGPCGNCF